MQHDFTGAPGRGRMRAMRGGFRFNPVMAGMGQVEPVPVQLVSDELPPGWCDVVPRPIHLGRIQPVPKPIQQFPQGSYGATMRAGFLGNPFTRALVGASAAGAGAYMFYRKSPKKERKTATAVAALVGAAFWYFWP